MQPPARHPDVDVAVVGCGPVGAVAANFLGLYGLRCAVFERETGPHGQPRAFSCDDEALRIYQQIGLVDRLRAGMIAADRVDYVGVEGRRFAQIVCSPLDFGSGYGPLHFFHQPHLEAALRAGLARFPRVSLHLGCELTDLRRREDAVELDLRQGDARSTIAARYVLACDGAHSAVRRLVGIAMQGARYEEPWLAVAGFAPPDAVRLPHTTFVCDPERPSFVGLGPAGELRIERMVLTGEDPAALEQPTRLRELVAPFVDPDRYRITRAAVYRFGKHVAERWQEGRVFLLGDAAHQMPPFMGQGLVSGLRDAANLAWKLALVLQGGADPRILASYEVERRAHTQAMIAISVRMGHVFLSRSRWSASLRDGLFRAVQRLARVRRFIRDFEFKPPPVHPRGLYAGERRPRGAAQGTFFPQAQVLVEGEAQLSDEALGPGFCAVGLDVDPRAALPPELWDRLDLRPVRVRERAGARVEGVVDVVDPAGGLARWFRRHDAEVALVRPDRFVFGAARRGDADALARALTRALGAPRREVAEARAAAVS